ncbi:MAG: hypothetical protein WCK05_14220, partial [Planctomycetota bacterium]
MTSKPPETPILFLDESLDSESVATALENAGAKVKRATKLFPRGTADEIWLEEAGKCDWIVLTRDKRIRYRHLERQSLQQAGVRTFVFIGGNVTIKDTTTILVKALPRILRISETVA